jgi:hypothetical protein
MIFVWMQSAIKVFFFCSHENGMKKCSLYELSKQTCMICWCGFCFAIIGETIIVISHFQCGFSKEKKISNNKLSSVVRAILYTPNYGQMCNNTFQFYLGKCLYGYKSQYWLVTGGITKYLEYRKLEEKLIGKYFPLVCLIDSYSYNIEHVFFSGFPLSFIIMG